jgi:cellulose synthase/poly-beta-1,6-N-acetylglucosamine synthase-like glycosyltransferase
MDYPKHLLDIKILIEQDDLKTAAILKELKLPSNYEFIYIPQSHPRTKAKACNYGLRFARGDYLTLYDAEDKPDPLQLRLALQLFNQHKNEQLACVQSRLNFYNSNENWLTKMFAIEYSYWFDLLLPALEYLGTPIPLGGTSNHFKTAILREIYAWDPYNVTEDADLGTRLDRLGYKTRVLASTTYEEATCRPLNWLRQRTRWIKGYMQTYMVHMRTPWQLWKTLGTKGFLGFQLFIGGTILTNLSNLLLWVIFILSCFSSTLHLDFLFPKEIILLSVINFILGSVGTITLNILGVISRKDYKLVPIAFTAPLYWLLMSIASYRALGQIIFQPSYWEKTEHGISKTLK